MFLSKVNFVLDVLSKVDFVCFKTFETWAQTRVHPDRLSFGSEDDDVNDGDGDGYYDENENNDWWWWWDATWW